MNMNKQKETRGKSLYCGTNRGKSRKDKKNKTKIKNTTKPSTGTMKNVQRI